MIYSPSIFENFDEITQIRLTVASGLFSSYGVIVQRLNRLPDYDWYYTDIYLTSEEVLGIGFFEEELPRVSPSGQSFLESSKSTDQDQRFDRLLSLLKIKVILS